MKKRNNNQKIKDVLIILVLLGVLVIIFDIIRDRFFSASVIREKDDGADVVKNSDDMILDQSRPIATVTSARGVDSLIVMPPQDEKISSSPVFFAGLVPDFWLSDSDNFQVVMTDMVGNVLSESSVDFLPENDLNGLYRFFSIIDFPENQVVDKGYIILIKGDLFDIKDSMEYLVSFDL